MGRAPELWNHLDDVTKSLPSKLINYHLKPKLYTNPAYAVNHTRSASISITRLRAENSDLGQDKIRHGHKDVPARL